MLVNSCNLFTGHLVTLLFLPPHSSCFKQSIIIFLCMQLWWLEGPGKGLSKNIPFHETKWFSVESLSLPPILILLQLQSNRLWQFLKKTLCSHFHFKYDFVNGIPCQNSLLHFLSLKPNPHISPLPEIILLFKPKSFNFFSKSLYAC